LSVASPKVEAALGLAFDHYELVGSESAQSVRMVQRTRSLQLGDLACAAVGVDRNAMEPVAFEDIGVNRAVGKNGDAVQLRLAFNLPSWVLRPDFEFVRPGLEA
jgi:hypothetical protein